MSDAVTLRRVAPQEARAASLLQPDAALQAGVTRILQEVASEGEPALRRWAQELGDLRAGEALFLARAELEAARDIVREGTDQQPGRWCTSRRGNWPIASISAVLSAQSATFSA